MGGHGLTAWGDSSESCEATSLDLIRRAPSSSRRHGRPDPLGPIRPGFEPLRPKRATASSAGRPGAGDPWPGRHRRPPSSAVGSTTTSSSTSSPARRRRGSSRWGPPVPTTSSAPRCDRCCSTCHRHSAARSRSTGSANCTREYREEYRPTTSAMPIRDLPPMRGADPAIFLIPGVGMFSFGADSQTARVAGEFYINAINVITGAEARFHLSASPRGGEVPGRVLDAGGVEAAPPPGSEAAHRQSRARHRCRLGHRTSHRRGIRRLGRGGGGGRHQPRRGTRRPPSKSARPTRPAGRGGCHRRGGRSGGVRCRCAAPSEASTSSSTTPVSPSPSASRHDRARLGPAARRDGQGLVPGVQARRGGDDRPGTEVATSSTW